MEKLLMEFAESQGVPKQEVIDFLNRKKDISTIDELSELPSELLNHIDYITWCPEPIKTYINENMWTERYMTITLDRVLDSIFDEIEENNEGNSELQRVVDSLIENRFGSVVYDW